MKIFNTRNDALDYLKLTLNSNPVTCEIGFFKGEFSKEITSKLQSSKHYVIDTFSDLNHISGNKDGINLQTQDMTKMYDYSKSLGYLTLKGDSYQLNTINEEFDFIYIDADHSYDWVMKDLKNAYGKIKKNGIIGGHDYSKSRFEGCFNAVNDFCNIYNLKIDILTNDGCPSYFIEV